MLIILQYTNHTFSILQLIIYLFPTLSFTKHTPGIFFGGGGKSTVHHIKHIGLPDDTV